MDVRLSMANALVRAKEGEEPFFEGSKKDAKSQLRCAA
jgi:hypothetical protein